MHPGPSPRPYEHDLPSRPPTASTPLWEHLTNLKSRSTPSLREMPIIAPPSAPLDKNATSIRILLHDTQANFEKFGKHAGALLEEAKETKYEIKKAYDLFEKDKEHLMGDIVDLINRSQKEIQKTFGQPMQSDKADNLFKDINHRLDEIDQRLDSIHAANQFLTQNLQTQMQATQILIDKQGTILTAVLPLLPLLQVVPVHLDALKSSLHETLTNHALLLRSSLSTSTASSMSPAQLENTFAESILKKRKRSGGLTALSSSPPLISELLDSVSPKRSKLENATYEACKTSPLNDLNPSENAISGLALGSSTDRVSNTSGHIYVSNSSPIPLEPERRRTFAIPTISTPPVRKLLTDLNVLSNLRLSRRRSSSRLQSLDLPSAQNSSTGTSHHDSSVHGDVVRRDSSTPPDSSTQQTGILIPPNSMVKNIGNLSTPRKQSASSSTILKKSENQSTISSSTRNHAFAALSSNDSAQPIPLCLPPPASVPASGNIDAPFGAYTVAASRSHTLYQQLIASSTPITRRSVHRDPEYFSPNGPNASAILNMHKKRDFTDSIASFSTDPNANNLYPTKAKERKYPNKDGRRFIPLVDSEDEEDDIEQKDGTV